MTLSIKPVIRRTEPRPSSLFPDAAAPPGLGAPPGRSRERYTGYRFPVLGQGTISFTFKANAPFRIVLNHDDQPSRGARDVIVLEVSRGRAAFLRANTDHRQDILDETTASAALLNPGDTQLAYWLSLDTNNRVLKYGKGEMLNRLVVWSYTFPLPAQGQPDPFAYIAKLCCVALVSELSDEVVDHALRSLPVCLDPAPQIIPDAQITLEDIATNTYSVAADLSQACQALYANVAGPGVTLRPLDFPEFPEAIDHSINTEGLFCYKVLAGKPKDFGYLRVTLDSNQGDSPGQPFVLEIWPAGNGSPIHDHGAACAVIKVLRGTIHVEWYPGLSPAIVKGWGSVDLSEGDVTFLTPQAYQIHQLKNPGTDRRMTATIQCYRYPDDDTVHYEYFDYIEGDKILPFTPDSDCDYLTFKEIIRKEWDAHLKAASKA